LRVILKNSMVKTLINECDTWISDRTKKCVNVESFKNIQFNVKKLIFMILNL